MSHKKCTALEKQIWQDKQDYFGMYSYLNYFHLLLLHHYKKTIAFFTKNCLKTAKSGLYVPL